MDEKELAELLKYSSPKELWVIDASNKLIVLYCPFKVKVNKGIGGLIINQIVYVEEIKITPDVITVYIIKKIAYYYYHFEIIGQ
jgi:hypothetical protein